MRDGISLVTDQVVESVSAVGVDEAVTNPFTRANAVSNVRNRLLPTKQKAKKKNQYLRLVDIRNDFKSCFDAIFLNLSRLHSLNVVFTGEAQDVKRIFASNSHQLAAL